MPIKVKNLPEVKARLYAWLQDEHQRSVLPLFKAVVRQSLRYAIDGDAGYVGTPQWTGNAAANWYPSRNVASAEYENFETELVGEIQPDPYDWDPGGSGDSRLFSARNPNAAAVEMSMARLDSFLDGLTSGIGGKLVVVLSNNTPYLFDFRPFGGERTFKPDNLWPIGMDRVMRDVAIDLGAGRFRNLT